MTRPIKNSSCFQVWVLNGFRERLIGMLGEGKRSLQLQEAWLFPRCNAVHTCFMRVPIDVVWLNQSGQVLRCQTLKPWTMAREGEAAMVLEAHSGFIEKHSIQPRKQLKEIKDDPNQSNLELWHFADL